MNTRGFLTRLRAHHWVGASAVMIFSLALLASCGKSNNPMSTGGGGTGGTTVHIVMNAMSQGASAFSPNPVTVAINTTVTWKNDDSITHTVTSNTAGQFNLTVGGGAQQSHTFTTAGTFPYHCAVSGHTMTGSVVVNP